MAGGPSRVVACGPSGAALATFAAHPHLVIAISTGLTAPSGRATPAPRRQPVFLHADNDAAVGADIAADSPRPAGPRKVQAQYERVVNSSAKIPKRLQHIQLMPVTICSLDRRTERRLAAAPVDQPLQALQTEPRRHTQVADIVPDRGSVTPARRRVRVAPDPTGGPNNAATSASRTSPKAAAPVRRRRPSRWHYR